MERGNPTEFAVLENAKVGRNLARFRRFKEKKALEVAEYIGIGEAAYTKYERGESKITVEIVQKVSEFLKVDPIQLLSSGDGNFVENGNYSPIAINGTVQTGSDQQTQILNTVMEKLMEMHEKVITLMDKNK